ncbi:hypothetical protein PSET11_02527 [Arthrobacter ulcerisalmonis]|uniref:PknH-like extracellular domain-containing protein n=2 Tax=Arthrobacter ulcerisalmonis TaxID=2483813 RepID=A0A3P5XNT6_9MICC|nr:hypothetical protein PSET11_02527 [Arthrobacter ulcerisalmonis]
MGDSMKTLTLRTLGATSLLALALAGCSSSSDTPAASESAPAAASAAPSSAAPTADTKYSAADLSGILEQVQDSTGNKLQVLPTTTIEGTVAQTKDLIASMDIKPEECKTLAASGSVPDIDGAVLAVGQHTDSATGSTVAVSLISGLDAAAFSKSLTQSTDLKSCADMSMTVAGMTVSVKVTVLDGVGSTPETLAYQTDTTLPNGTVQSVVTAQLQRNGVVISTVASGGANVAANAAEAGSLIDATAALIK